MPSILIPAHDEERVIAGHAARLTSEAPARG